VKQATNPHILTLSPPLNLKPQWFAPHLAYSISKYGMSLCMLGMAAEYRAAGIACNALWPRTTIATAAVEFALGGAAMLQRSRKPEIVADAAYLILNRSARECTGQFFIDDAVLSEAGVRDSTPTVSRPGVRCSRTCSWTGPPVPPGVQLQFLYE
jgi:citronellol/citronellal dehydrogenase